MERKKRIAAFLLACVMSVLGIACALAEGLYTAGEYSAEAAGKNGPVCVKVTVTENEIAAVEVLTHQETPGLSDPAINGIPAEIVAKQSLNIDAVAGATVTSNAILEAASQALASAGADVEALKQKEVAEEVVEQEDVHTQIVVAGGGMAGLLAAISAADAGAQVVLVEKMSALGGSLAVASGTLLTVESEYTKDIADELERATDYFHLLNDGAKHQPDYAFLSAILEKNGETIDFMTGKLGLKGTVSDANFAKVSFEGRGAGLVIGLEQAANDKQVTVLKNTKAERILMEDGKAVGISVSNKNGSYNVYADKVIIATGGASGDSERMHKFIPELNTVDLYEKACVGNTGDGFTMLEEVGADIVQDLFVKASAPEFAEVFAFTISNKPSVAQQMIVDAQGVRFVNESPLTPMMLTTDMIAHESPAYYAIYDTVHISDELKASFDALIGNEDKKVVVWAETPEALAQKLGMDASVFTATLSKYQEACQTGADSEFGKSADMLVPYELEGGLYAAYQIPSSYGTIGGCVTDLSSHVLDKDGNIIQNLFAAGEMSTFNLFGDYYVGGGSLGLYATTGRIAGLTAVDELAE